MNINVGLLPYSFHLKEPQVETSYAISRMIDSFLYLLISLYFLKGRGFFHQKDNKYSATVLKPFIFEPSLFYRFVPL